jgi:hypothetical protein
LVILLSPFPPSTNAWVHTFRPIYQNFSVCPINFTHHYTRWGIMTILHLSSLYYDDDWFVCHLSYVLIVPVKKSLSSS